MLRSLLLALVMVSALLVLLAGASGGLRSLPNPSAMLSAMVTTVTANSAGPSRGESQSAAVVPSASAQRSAPDLAAGQQAATPASQPPPGALERQVSDLEAQLKERSQELDSVRASQEQVRRDVGSLLQQRQAATQAPPSPSPPPQAEAAPTAPAAVSPKDAASRRTAPEQPRREAGPTQQRSTEATLSRLRSQQRPTSTAQTVAASPPVPHVQPSLQAQPEAPPTSLAPPQAYAAQPAPMPSPAANLMTARQLLAYGRTEEARNLLVRLQTQMVLQPVAPDQPTAQGGNVAATRIGDAIRSLDQGNPTRAMQAINVAMSSPAAGPAGDGQSWQRYPASAPPRYVYPPSTNYNDGHAQR
jgi:hypothetical protein